MDTLISQYLKETRSKLLKQDNNRSEDQYTSDLVPASILIPITVIGNKLVILFTKRTGMVNNHQNQISFPGGKIDLDDENPLSASLRETREEIGISKNEIEILGSLQPRKTSTGFFIYPFVGFLHDLTGIQLNPIEVEKIIYFPIDWLQDPKNSHYEIYQGKSSIQHSILVFSIFEGEIVWGITAALVKDFLCLK